MYVMKEWEIIFPRGRDGSYFEEIVDQRASEEQLFSSETLNK
jgi:hypothetical protein